MLAAPIYTQGATARAVQLPAGAWWDFWTSQRIEGGQSATIQAPLDSMPLLVRAGSVLPTGPVKQYADEPSSDPLTLTVYPGADGAFTLYDDDGSSFAYEHGDFQAIDLRWDDVARTLTLHHAQGTRTQPRSFRVKLAGGAEQSVTFRGGSVTLHLT